MMALLTWPTAAKTMTTNLELEIARSVVESPTSFRQQVATFQGARWHGTMNLAPVGFVHPAGEVRHQDGLAIEAFLRLFTDPAHTVEMPVQRPAATLSGATVGSVTGDTIDVAGDAGATAIPGSLIRSGTRTWQVVGVSGLSWQLKPSVIMPGMGEGITGVSTILARIRPDTRVASVRSYGTMGPWVIPWVEAI